MNLNILTAPTGVVTLEQEVELVTKQLKISRELQASPALLAHLQEDMHHNLADLLEGQSSLPEEALRSRVGNLTGRYQAYQYLQMLHDSEQALELKLIQLTRNTTE